jgi:hypothetical protein
MKPNLTVKYFLLLFFMLFVGGVWGQTTQKPTQNSKFNKHNNFKKTDPFKKKDNNLRGVPNPGDGDTGNPSPVSPTLWLISIGSLSIWLMKYKNEKRK